MALFKLLHLFSVLVWVGGMFFAYMVLRPAAAELLPPPDRLRLWQGVLTRFFNWVWLAIFLLLSSGFYMVYLYGGFTSVPRYVLWMFLLGMSMLVIYGYVFFVCYVRLSLQVNKQNWPDAAATLATIRKLVATNLSLGLFTITLVEFGRAW